MCDAIDLFGEYVCYAFCVTTIAVNKMKYAFYQCEWINFQDLIDDQMNLRQSKMDHAQRASQFTNGCNCNKKTRSKNATKSFLSFEFITTNVLIIITIAFLLFIISNVSAKHQHLSPQVT